MNKAELLGKESIQKLLIKFSVPASVGLLVIVLYNIVDTIFVGRGVGTLGIAGLAVVLPFQMLIATIGQTIGIGGASIVSRNLGAKRYEIAYLTFGNLIALTGIVSVGFVVVGYLFVDKVLYIFGAQADILQYAKDYFTVTLVGAPFLAYAMMTNNVIRSEGDAKIPMITMILSALINVILDPIFIFGMDMGIKGAALATVIAQFIAFGYLVYYFIRGKSIIKLSTKYLRLEKAIVKEIFAIGSSTFARQGSQSIIAAILNHSLYKYGGQTSVAVFGILDRIIRFVFFPVIGIVQAVLSIIGYNYGAKLYGRVKETIIKSNLMALIVTLIGFTAIQLFPGTIISFFSNDPELIQEGTRALRIVFLLIPLAGIQIIGASYFQAIGKAKPAFILTISRQVLFLIPLILILPLFLQLDGLWVIFCFC